MANPDPVSQHGGEPRLPRTGFLNHQLGLIREGAHRDHIVNLLSTIVTRTVALGLFALVVPYFLNRSPASAFANASLLLLVFAYMQLLDFGIGYAVIQRFGRAVANNDAQAIDVLQAALPLYFLVAGTLSVLTWAMADDLSRLLFGTVDFGASVRYLAIGTIPLVLSAFLTAILQAHNRLVWMNLSRMIAEIAKAAGFLLSASRDGDVKLIVAVAVGGVAAKFIVDLVVAYRLIGNWQFCLPRFSSAEMRSNLSLGAPMVIALLLGIVNTMLDRIYVSRLLGADALAHYSIAYDLNSKAFFLVGAVGAALYTPMLRRAAHGHAQRGLVLAQLAAVAGVTIFYFIPLGLFSEDFLGWWINDDIARSTADVTRIAVLMSIIYLLMSVGYNLLQAIGRSVVVMSGAAAASLLIVCGLWLMPRDWGVAGVMGIVAIGFAAQLCVYIAVILRSSTTAVPAAPPQRNDAVP